MSHNLAASARRAALAAVALCVLAPARASAHPHVWVAVEATVAYADGKISGLVQRWTFDEMYAAQAIQGLDTNGDGAYDKAELAELAKINIEGLEGYGYFTVAKLGETRLVAAPPKDYWLEYKDGVLALEFTLPLAEPVLAGAEGFTFSVFDPEFYIAFDMAKDKPVRLAAAPPGCAATVGVPQAETAAAEQLGQAFGAELGGGANWGASFAKTVSVTCPKS